MATSPTAEWQRQMRSSPVLKWMVDKGIPLTRENYISLNWLSPPEEWTAEHEADLPEMFQRPDFWPAATRWSAAQAAGRPRRDNRPT